MHITIFVLKYLEIYLVRVITTSIEIRSVQLEIRNSSKLKPIFIHPVKSEKQFTSCLIFPFRIKRIIRNNNNLPVPSSNPDLKPNKFLPYISSTVSLTLIS